MKINGMDYEGTGMDASEPSAKATGSHVEARPLVPGNTKSIFGPETDKLLGLNTAGGAGSGQEHISEREKLLNKGWKVRDATGKSVGGPVSVVVDSGRAAVERATPIVPTKPAKRSK